MPRLLEPETLRVALPGGAISALAWGDAAAPLLLFSHATGMCAGLYAELLAPLATQYRVVAFDARGHGHTTLAADPNDVPVEWLRYREDLRHLVAALGGGPVLLAGHSFGATVAFQAAVETPGLARAVVLIEPAFIPFDHAPAYREARAAGRPLPNIMADRAARRRADFDSMDSMRAAYSGRGVFAGWSADALEAYLVGGTERVDEAVQLACAPAWEASSFRGVSTSMEASFRECRLPFTLLYGDVGSTVVPEDAVAIVAMHPTMMVRAFPGTGHFLPVTHPDLVRPFFELSA